jgi:thiosulfate reductase cytochrome b subunit
MADSTYVTMPAVQCAEAPDTPRHSAIVRITHWIFTLSFFGLVVSGFAIILAHPRFCWGETGGKGGPSLFDLPLPTMLGGPSGWGRSLHFQSAWLAVLAGSLYIVSGIFTRHFRNDLLPARADLSPRSLREIVLHHISFKKPTDDRSYNILQRISYLGVVFVIFPLMILTGFAMSPAITSVFPFLVVMFGGHQSARTIYFFAANFLLLFLVVHVAMVVLAGFTTRMRAMITGRSQSRKIRS